MKNIAVYSTPTCPYCRLAKDYLSEKGIEFTDYNVATDLEARNVMVQKSGQLGVPVIEIDGQVVIGFNKQKIEELIGS
ncbi:MAG: glutaredoxin domain-containing protein [Armatimonadota bacterium]